MGFLLCSQKSGTREGSKELLMARRMKAETLWKKAKQWCAAQGIPYTYAGAQGIAPF
jgi:hypothetical protein